MTIQKTGFLKQLSNGCKVYTQKVGTNAVTEVLNKDGMHTASRIKSFNRYSCGNKKVVEQTKFTRKLNNGIDTIEKEVTHRFMTITINCLAPEHYSLLIRLKQTILMQDC